MLYIAPFLETGMAEGKYADFVDEVERRRMDNHNYREGYLRGQHDAVKLMARAMDEILSEHDDLAESGSCADEDER